MDHSPEAAAEAIVAVCRAVSKAVLQRARHQPEEPLEDLELAVREAARELGACLMAAAVVQRQAHEPAPPCRHCAGETGRDEWRARRVDTLLGAVDPPLLSWRCAACGRITPGSVRRELRHGCTPGLARLAAQLGALAPFRRAERVLAKFGLSLSDNRIADLTRAVGGELAAMQEAEAEAVAAGRLELLPEQAPERLYVEADGFKVQVLAAGGRRGPGVETWREVRAGLCFRTAAAPPDAQGQPPRPEGLVCRALWGNCEAFDRWFYPEVQRQGVNQAWEVVILCDGAPWLREHLKQYVRVGVKLVEILDWYHASENLAKAVRARYGSDAQAFERVYEELRAQLWAGRASAVVGRLASWLRAGEPGAKEVREVLRYLWANRARMRYPRLRAGGYHIGSGQVESLCKQLGERVKGADRVWSRAGLAAVLALRCQWITEEHQQPRAA